MNHSTMTQIRGKFPLSKYPSNLSHNNFKKYFSHRLYVFLLSTLYYYFNPAQGGVFVYGKGEGVESTPHIFISPHRILEAPKCTYMIFGTFPIISQNPHDRIYKTPSAGDLRSLPSPENFKFSEIFTLYH